MTIVSIHYVCGSAREVRVADVEAFVTAILQDENVVEFSYETGEHPYREVVLYSREFGYWPEPVIVQAQ